MLALAGVLTVVAGVGIGITVYHATKHTGTTVQPVEHKQPAVAPRPVQTVLPFRGLNEPNGVAVDSAGNVYVVDERNNRVVELAAGSTAQQTLPFTGLNGPLQVAVDVGRNVYVADAGNNWILKLAAGSSEQQVVPFTGIISPAGVAVGWDGAVYITDTGNSRVLKLSTG